MHNVFVYGTLKRGEPNEHWLTNKDNGVAKFVSEAATIENYPLVIASKYNIPFLLDKRGTGKVVNPIYITLQEKMQTICTDLTA